MAKKAYTVDLDRRIVDTVIIWAEDEAEAREYANKRFVEEVDEFPTGAIFDTEVVGVDESDQSYEELRGDYEAWAGYVQYNIPWDD